MARDESRDVRSQELAQARDFRSQESAQALAGRQEQLRAQQEFAGAQGEAGRQAQAERQRERIEADRIRQQEAQAGRRDMANLTASLRPGPAPAAEKPLPIGALKIQDEAVESLRPVNQVNASLQILVDKIDQGKLTLGPVSNTVSRGLNAVGRSSENSQNFAALNTELEGARNAIMMLAKGVQTEGDAQRAMDQILQTRNDPKIVREALQRLIKLNNDNADKQIKRVNTVRQNYGAGPMDFGGFFTPPSAAGTIPQVPGAAALPVTPQPGQTLNMRAPASGGALSAPEQAELQALRQRLGR